MEIDYYTYVYIDPRNGLPFYVGKGKGDRKYIHLWYTKNNRHINKHLENKIKQIWKDELEPTVKIVYNGSEDFALIIEEKLISNFKKEGIKLCNLTSGGEGFTKKHTEETKKKLSNYKCSEEKRKKLSDAAKKQWSNEKNRKKMSDIKKKQYKDNTGLIEKLRESHLGKKDSDETREKKRLANLKRYSNPEERLKTSMAAKKSKIKTNKS